MWGNHLHNVRTVYNGKPLSELFHGQAPDLHDLRVFGGKVHVLYQAPERQRLHIGKMAPRTRECVYLGHKLGTKGALVWDPHAQRVLTSRDVTYDETAPYYAPAPPPKELTSHVNEEEVLFPIAEPPLLLPAAETSSLPVLSSPELVPPAPGPAHPISPAPVPVQTESVLPTPDQAPEPGSTIPPAGTTPDSPVGIVALPRETLASEPTPVDAVPEVEPKESQPKGGKGPQRQQTRMRKTAEERLLKWSHEVGAREPSARLRGLPPQANRTVTDHQAVPIPTTVAEALQGPQAKEWQAALAAEMQSMRDNDVWELVPRPEKINIVGSKWVLALKVNEKGEVERYKARLVAQGFTQRKGVDYNEVFASVIGKTSTRVVLHIAAHRDMEVDVSDVSTAFLNARLQEGVYMKQPPGFEDPEHPDWVCRLKKSLYGLKQAARCWFQELSSFLVDQGFEAHPLDPCLFTKVDEAGNLLMILVYVDDLVMAADKREQLDAFKQALGDRFAIKDLGPIKFYLGLEVERERDKRELRLHQRGYIQEVLARFNMSECNPTKTPLEVNHDLSVEAPFAVGEEQEMRQVPYAELIGCLMYIMVCTRPDLAFPVSLLARFMAEGAYRRKHWEAAKRVLRYIKGTMEWGLVLGGSAPIVLSMAADSSWGDCLQTRRSSQGYVATLGASPVSWKSQRSEAVAKSTAEAEYYAVGQAGREIVFLRNLLEYLGYPQTKATVLQCDSQSAQAIVHGEGITNRTKHIDIRHHWIREQVQKGIVSMQHVPSEENTADLMTKALGIERHTQLAKHLGLVPLASRAMGGCQKERAGEPFGSHSSPP
jgi:hypothetical protein